MDAATVKRVLERAKEEREIVRVHREALEDGWADGFVAGLGPDFFALLTFDKAVRFDGFQCFRYRDVTDLVAPAPHARFLNRVVAARGQLPIPSLPVELSSLTSLLKSVGRAYPLACLFYEQDDAVCYIGRVQSIVADEIEILEIFPDAEWDRAPTLRKLSGITSVSFGGAYEAALHLAAPTN
jgi:hypothetical protein